MTCQSCQLATERPSHEFQSGCKGCKARALSRGQDFWQSKREGKQTRLYQSALMALDLTHAEVLEWATKDKLKP